MITHDLGVVAEMADYVVVMYAGKVIEKGTRVGKTENAYIYDFANDPELKEIYRKGFRSWRYSLQPEYNPGYDFLYFLSDPDNAKPDAERIRTWFYRFNVSRIASGVSLTSRVDYPQKLFKFELNKILTYLF